MRSDIVHGDPTQRTGQTICLVIHSLQAGGMERVMAELATYFSSQAGLKVVLILYGIKPEIFYQIPDNVVVYKPRFDFNDSYRLISTVRRLFYLRKTIHAIRPKCVLSFGEYWNSFVLLATLGLPYPVYVSDRSQPDKSLGKTHDFLRKVLYPRATGVIAQTALAKEIFSRMYKARDITVIGNPVRSISRENGPPRENFVLMVGRLIQSKNQEALISIFLKINMPDWKLVLVGYDHMKQQNLQRLKKLAEDLGGKDRVVFAGKQSDVDQFYLTSKIFAFTSLSEGFPNVIGEAMSAGLPVVAFDCVAGPAEMIEDGKNGFLIPLNNHAKFQEKLELLMRDESYRELCGRAGEQTIKRFSMANIGNVFLQYLLSSKH